MLMALSPLEAHGAHLPLETDILVAEKLLERYIELLQEKFPDYDLVRLPSLPMGSDALPRPGSLDFPARLLEKTLYSLARNMAGWGFKFLFIADNHGGPRHLLACEAAARKAYRRLGFYLINPFNREFALMMNQDPWLLESDELDKGSCGDLHDLHGGSNETSLMLALSPDKVKDQEKVSQEKPPPPAPLFAFAARLFKALGRKKTGEELMNLGSTAAWAADKNGSSYIGAPDLASKGRGEAMLAKRLENAEELFTKAINGEAVPMKPPLWSLRILRFLPI